MDKAVRPVADVPCGVMKLSLTCSPCGPLYGLSYSLAVRGGKGNARIAALYTTPGEQRACEAALQRQLLKPHFPVELHRRRQRKTECEGEI